MTTFTIAITDNMEIGFFAQGQDAKQSKMDLEALLALLESDQELDLDISGEIENHRDQDRLTRVHDLTHA